MMTFVIGVIGMMAVTAEGWCLVNAVAPLSLSRSSRALLGYPVGLLMNAIIITALHVTGMGLSAMMLGLAHVVLLIAAYIASRRWFLQPHPPVHPPAPKVLVRVCGVIIAVTAASAAISALLLPTRQWDAFTNWTMRAQQIHDARMIVFEGAAKPQYPILLHGAQLMANIRSDWNDTSANASTLLLTLTGFAGLFCIVRTVRGNTVAWMTLAGLAAMPLLAVHAGQGLADIHVTMYVLLTATCLDGAVLSGKRRWLALGAIFAAAAAWTKLEGLYFALLPWVVLLPMQRWRMEAVAAAILAVPWPLLVIFSGLPLSPHGASVGVHMNAIAPALQAVFVDGSFGVHGWGIALCLVILLWKRPRATLFDTTVLWALWATAFVFGIYFFTADAQGLTTMTGFGRTMLLPVSLWTLALAKMMASSPEDA